MEVTPPIVECAYDPTAGTWRLHAVRTDKAQPNHIRVVFDTMESIAENISREEIGAVCEGARRGAKERPPAAAPHGGKPAAADGHHPQ